MLVVIVVLVIGALARLVVVTVLELFNATIDENSRQRARQSVSEPRVVAAASAKPKSKSRRLYRTVLALTFCSYFCERRRLSCSKTRRSGSLNGGRDDGASDSIQGLEIAKSMATQPRYAQHHCSTE